MVSLWQHGYFYYLDVLFLLLGLIYLFSKPRPAFLLLTSLILISPIPEAIRIDRIPAYAFHSVLQYPFLIILISAGIYFTLNSIPKLKYPLLFAYTLLFLISSISIFSVIRFSSLKALTFPVVFSPAIFRWNQPKAQ